MNFIFIFPVLLILICVVSEHQAAVLDDCEDDVGTGQRKTDTIPIKSVRPPRINQKKFTTVQNKPAAYALRRARKSFHGGQFQRRIMPYPTKFAPSIRPQESALWQPKPKTVFLKPTAGRKLNDYYPAPQFKPQKARMQFMPAYDEYDSHETEYDFPERSFEYVEMEDMGNYLPPCDPNDPMMNRPVMNRPKSMGRPSINRGKNDLPQPKEMDNDSNEPNSSNESEMRDGLVSTTENPEDNMPEHTMKSNIGTQHESINQDSSNHETIKQVVDLITKGLCSMISCLKVNNPNLHEALAKILNSAFNTCKTLKN